MADGLSHRRKCALSTVSARVNGAHTDVPVLFTHACLPAEMFDAGGNYPAQDGGGDIRFSSDPAGLDLLPCEVVTFSTDDDPGQGEAEIWVRLPHLRDSQADTVYVWWNTAGTHGQPPVTAPNGRNAVWAGAAGRWHFGETGVASVDSTGNGNDGALVGDAARAGGRIGQGVALDGSADYVEMADDGTLNPAAAFTFAAWIKPASLSARACLISKYDTAGNQRAYAVDVSTNGGGNISAVLGDGGGFLQAVSNSVLSTSTWSHVVATWDKALDGGAIRIFLNGREVSYSIQNNKTSDMPPNGLPLRIGRTYLPARDFNGLLDEVHLEGRRWSADWVATTFANQDDPASFVTVAAPESVGAGAVTLGVDGSLMAQEAGVAALSQLHPLRADGAALPLAAGAVVLEQRHGLAVADSGHAHLSGAMPFAAVASLAADEAAHTHTSGSAVLGQEHLLAVEGAVHASRAGRIGVSYIHPLACAVAWHAHGARTAILTMASGGAPPDRLTAIPADSRSRPLQAANRNLSITSSR